MQYQEVAGGICAPKGFAAAGVHCGIRANHAEKYDLALIKADVRCAAAGVYTTNKVCGAPIKVDRAHLTDGYAQAIVVNSGNANTCAANGVALAEECCELVGKALNIDAKDVLPSSTGVIGQPMVIDPFARGIPAAAAKLAADAQGSTDAATAIMTTDTHKKEYAIQFELGGKTCTVGAIGKGSGMIAPNMATMLAFYTTDAADFPRPAGKGPQDRRSRDLQPDERRSGHVHQRYPHHHGLRPCGQPGDHRGKRRLRRLCGRTDRHRRAYVR